MITEVYFMRHSKPLKINNSGSLDDFQLRNEKSILSIDGENLAKILSELEEFKNFDVVISSNYVRLWELLNIF